MQNYFNGMRHLRLALSSKKRVLRITEEVV
jgi:hypothetical protein